MHIVAPTDGPDTEREKLAKHPPRTTHYGRPMAGVIVGTVFAAIGAGITSTATGIIPVDESSFGGAPDVAAAFGGVFLLTGLVIALISNRLVRKQTQRKETLKRNPNEPWKADFPWDPRGISDSRRDQIVKSFGFGLFIVIFMAPFAWLALRGAIVAWIFVALFDIAALLLIGRGVYLILLGLKFGIGWVSFERFPYHPGDTLDIGFTNPSISSYSRMTFTLRFIQEVTKVRGTSKNRRYETI